MLIILLTHALALTIGYFSLRIIKIALQEENSNNRKDKNVKKDTKIILETK